MFNFGRNLPPYIVYELELISNGETIDKYPYPMVPNINDTVQVDKEKSFTVTSRTFKTFSEGMGMPIFVVKLFGTLKIDETISNDTETLEDKETT